jgi:hypothetical protein
MVRGRGDPREGTDEEMDKLREETASAMWGGQCTKVAILNRNQVFNIEQVRLVHFGAIGPMILYLSFTKFLGSSFVLEDANLVLRHEVEKLDI